MKFKKQEPNPPFNPRTVFDYYSNDKGITKKSIEENRWVQWSTLQKIGIGASFLLVLPTGEGKTLLADFLTAGYLDQGKKVLFCVPFLALMNEQFKEALKKWPKETSGIRSKRFVKGSFGCSIERSNLIFCTYERAQGILQRLIVKNFLTGDSNPFSKIGLIVMDEVHIISDGHRGQVVEWLIMMARANNIPILALTGTMELKDAFTLGNYMNSTVIFSEIRSVPLPIRFYFSSLDPLKMPLKEASSAIFKKLSLIKNGDKFFEEQSNQEVSVKQDISDFNLMNDLFQEYPQEKDFEDLQKIEFKEIRAPSKNSKKRPLLIAMAVDYLTKSDPKKDQTNGVLIYVPTKIQINELLNNPPGLDWKNIGLPKLKINAGAYKYLERKKEEINKKKIKLSPINSFLIPLGYAAHTADIETNEEKDLIIDLYEHHAIRIIFATSTLSAGVNLKNLTLVIVAGTWRFGHKIPMNEIIQTAGRAGRSPGYPGEAWIFYSLEDDYKTLDPILDPKGKKIKTSFWDLRTCDNPGFKSLVPENLHQAMFTITQVQKEVLSPSEYQFPEIDFFDEDPLELRMHQFEEDIKDWRYLKLSNQSLLKQVWNFKWKEERNSKSKKPFDLSETYGLDVLNEYTSFMILKKAFPFIRSIKCDKCTFPITSNENNCLKVMCQLMGIYRKSVQQAYDCFLQWKTPLKDVISTMMEKKLIDERTHLTSLGQDVGILNMEIDEVQKTRNIFSEIKEMMLKIGANASFQGLITIWMVILCSDISLLEGPVRSICSKLSSSKDGIPNIITDIVRRVSELYKQEPFQEFYDLIFFKSEILQKIVLFNESKKKKDEDVEEKDLLSSNEIIRLFSFLVVKYRLDENPQNSLFKEYSCYVGDIIAAFIDGIRILIDYINCSPLFPDDQSSSDTTSKIFVQSPKEQLLAIFDGARRYFKLHLDPYNQIIYNYLSIKTPSFFTSNRLYEISAELRKQWKTVHKGHYDKEKDVSYLAQFIIDLIGGHINLFQVFTGIRLTQEERSRLKSTLVVAASVSNKFEDDPLCIELKNLEITPVSPEEKKRLDND